MNQTATQETQEYADPNGPTARYVEQTFAVPVATLLSWLKHEGEDPMTPKQLYQYARRHRRYVDAMYEGYAYDPR